MACVKKASEIQGSILALKILSLKATWMKPGMKSILV